MKYISQKLFQISQYIYQRQSNKTACKESTVRASGLQSPRAIMCNQLNDHSHYITLITYIIYTFLLLCVIIKLGIYLKVFVVWITHSKCQICMPFQTYRSRRRQRLFRGGSISNSQCTTLTQRQKNKKRQMTHAPSALLYVLKLSSKE